MQDLGDRTEDSTVDFTFSTFDTDGAPITLAGTPAVSVYKANGTTQSTAGVTLSVDFDSVTGLHHVRIDTSADAFYAAAADYSVVITTGTVASVSVVGTTLATFSIENRNIKANATQFAGQTITAAAGVAMPSDPADQSLIIAATDAIISAIAALNNLSSAQAQTAAAAALTAYDPPTNAEMEARTLVAASYATAAALATADGVADAILVIANKVDTALELDGSVYRFTTNALEQGPAGGGGGTMDWSDLVADIDDVPNSVGAKFAILFTTSDSLVLSEEAVQTIADAAAASAVAALTDVDQEPVPSSRTFTLVPDDEEGLVGESAKGITIGNPNTYAVDFLKDLPVNGRIVTVQAPDIITGTSGGVLFTELGRDKSLAKFRAEGVTAGTYSVRVEVVFDTGATSRGTIVFNVAE